MKRLKNILNLWKNVLGSKNYIFIVLGVTLIFYIFNALISNFRSITYAIKNSGFSEGILFGFTLIWNFKNSILFSSLITLLLIGFLTGILVSLMTYRFKSMKKNNLQKVGILTSAGIFLGILAPGCAACGVGLVGLFGLSGSLASLPFQGKEINVIAIGLLSFSIINISRKIALPISCDVGSYNQKMKGGLQND